MSLEVWAICSRRNNYWLKVAKRQFPQQLEWRRVEIIELSGENHAPIGLDSMSD